MTRRVGYITGHVYGFGLRSRCFVPAARSSSGPGFAIASAPIPPSGPRMPELPCGRSIHHSRACLVAPTDAGRQTRRNIDDALLRLLLYGVRIWRRASTCRSPQRHAARSAEPFSEPRTVLTSTDDAAYQHLRNRRHHFQGFRKWLVLGQGASAPCARDVCLDEMLPTIMPDV